MDTVEQLLSLGLGHHRAGRLEQAAHTYRKVLGADPGNADAHHLLGVIAYQAGRFQEAADLIGEAIEANPDFVEALNNLGSVFKDWGRPEEAEKYYRRALSLKPDHTEAHYNLGVTLTDRGRLDEAIGCYRQALDMTPHHTESLNNLGLLLKDQGACEEAVACFTKALEISPGHAQAHNNLGNALRDQGRFAQAVDCFRKALESVPDYADAHNNLGNALRDLNRTEKAVECFRKALEIKPNHAEAYNNLGVSLKDLGRLDQAEAHLRKALEINPNYAEAYNNLGNVLRQQSRLDDSTTCYKHAIRISPDYAEAYNNLSIAFQDQGRPDEAEISCRKAIELKPDYAKALSNLLFSSQYRRGATARTLHELHKDWENRFGAPLRAQWTNHKNDRDPEKRLRVGFVSADFGRHPVGFFLLKLLENSPKDQMETLCYSDRTPDDMTHRLKSAADGWLDIQGLSDEELAARVRSDRVDILFDMAGHTARNRLLTFARKPAPLQVTWAGYVGTTGLAAMDYLLSDKYYTPEGEDPYYRESVLRMPDAYVCYEPPPYAPDVGPLPARKNGFVTFGSFNNPGKINERVMALWGDILAAVPGSKLLLKYGGIDSQANRERFQSSLAARGLNYDRLILEGKSPHSELLARYNDVDIALDPFPYSGGLTTCEALWMGVPVITTPGQTFAGRHSQSHNMTVGLSDLVARDTSHYGELAVALANDRARLTLLRNGLRARMESSALCDGPRFAANFTKKMRSIWRKWCLE